MSLLKGLIVNRPQPLFLKIIIGQAFFYLLLFNSSGNKTFFPFVLLFAFFLFLILEDWREAAWLTLVAVLPFAWGLRVFKVNVPLPAYFFSYTLRPFEKPFLYFPLSAKFLIILILLLTMPFNKKTKKLKGKGPDLLLFLFLIFSAFSVMKSSHINLSLIRFAEIFQAVIFYYLALFFLKDKKMFLYTTGSLFFMAAFQGGWALIQFN